MKKIIVAFIFLSALVYKPSIVFAETPLKNTNQIFQITNSGVQENAPLIYKDLIIFRRHTSPDVDIFSYNLESDQEFPLVVRQGHQSPVGIFNKYLLYNEEISSDNTDVRIRNLENGEDFPVVEKNGYQTAGGIWGNKVVYIDGYNCGEFHVFNINSQEDINTSISACGPFNISGETLVWSDWNNNFVYGYNLETSSLFTIAEGEGKRTTPDIFGDTVVWVEYINNKSNIVSKNLISGITENLYTVDGFRLNWPKISNQFIVWVDSRGIGAHDIVVFNRQDQNVVELTDFGIQQPSPTIPYISKNTVVWMSWHTGNGDIYAAKLPYTSNNP